MPYSDRPLGVPTIGRIDFALIQHACRLAWNDLRTAPRFGLFFAGVYVALGWGMLYLAYATGQTYWAVLVVSGFPIIGPFAAVGLYEVSRRLDMGLPLNWADILTVIAHQRKRQLPSISAVIIVILLFWFFLGHMIFALFMGLSVMTNISSSIDVFLTPNGLMMLGFGTVIGAAFSLLVYMITVISLPLLLDREVDFVTAMITSFQTVQTNFMVMIGWALFIAVLTFVAMIPAFVGLFLTLPLFGHASWHVYRLARDRAK
ncbi:MAG TPA: hypothetical protein DCY34_08560 [Rhodobacteraceae bacterium]|nr:hypothetical protein [Paracoccaceae bacterium]